MGIIITVKVISLLGNYYVLHKEKNDEPFRRDNEKRTERICHINLHI